MFNSIKDALVGSKDAIVLWWEANGDFVKETVVNIGQVLGTAFVAGCVGYTIADIACTVDGYYDRQRDNIRKAGFDAGTQHGYINGFNDGIDLTIEIATKTNGCEIAKPMVTKAHENLGVDSQA